MWAVPSLRDHVFNREPAGRHRHKTIQQFQGGESAVSLHYMVPVAVRHHQKRLTGKVALVGDGSQHFQQALVSNEAADQGRLGAASYLTREAWVVRVEIKLVDGQLLQYRLVGRCHRGGSGRRAHSRVPIQTALPIISKSVARWSMRMSVNYSWSGALDFDL